MLEGYIDKLVNEFYRAVNLLVIMMFIVLISIVIIEFIYARSSCKCYCE